MLSFRLFGKAQLFSILVYKGDIVVVESMQATLPPLVRIRTYVGGLTHARPTSLMDCTLDTCSVVTSPYGYRPNLVASAFLLAFFSFFFLFCAGIGLATRRYTSFSTFVSISCIFEMATYALRANAWDNPWKMPELGVELLFSTIGPVFGTLR